jgi:hypothetical protein
MIFLLDCEACSLGGASFPILPAGGVAAEEAENVAPGPRHRTLPDAQRLWRTSRAVQQAVARHVGDETPR